LTQLHASVALTARFSYPGGICVVANECGVRIHITIITIIIITQDYTADKAIGPGEL
jgi:hypothetical protein